MKRKIVSFLLWSSIACLISSCMDTGRILGFSKHGKEKPAANEISSEIAILLSYNKHLAGLSKEGLEKERAKAETALADFNAPIHRLRLALILSLSDPGSEDYLRAQNLLSNERPGEVKPDPVLRDFALLLASSLRRIEEQEARLQNLIHAQQEQAGQDRELSQKIKNQENQNQKLLQKLKEEQEQSQKLQKIIEELKTVEKNIMKRDNGNASQ